MELALTTAKCHHCGFNAIIERAEKPPMYDEVNQRFDFHITRNHCPNCGRIFSVHYDYKVRRGQETRAQIFREWSKRQLAIVKKWFPFLKTPDEIPYFVRGIIADNQ